MLGWVEKTSMNLSKVVIFFCRTASTSFLSPIPIPTCFSAAESISDRSGSEMNSALNELEPLGLLRLLWLCFIVFVYFTIFAKPSESFCAPSSTMDTLCLSAKYSRIRLR